jgi:hypothetical protein
MAKPRLAITHSPLYTREKFVVAALAAAVSYLIAWHFLGNGASAWKGELEASSFTSNRLALSLLCLSAGSFGIGFYLSCAAFVQTYGPATFRFRRIYVAVKVSGQAGLVLACLSAFAFTIINTALEFAR